MKDLYQILDIDPSTDEAGIKEAFRAMAKIHHPDKGGDEELFNEIKVAYETLVDPDKRAAYDATGCFDELQADPYPKAIEKVASMASGWVDMTCLDGDFLIFVSSITEEAADAAEAGIEAAERKLSFAQRFEVQLKWFGGEDPSPAHTQITKEIRSLHESIKIFRFELEVAAAVGEIMKDYQLIVADALSNVAIGG